MHTNYNDKRLTSFEMVNFQQSVEVKGKPVIIDDYSRPLLAGFLFTNDTFKDLLKEGMTIKQFKQILAPQLEKKIDEFEIRCPSNKSAPLSHNQDAYDTLYKAQKIFICYYK